MKEIVNKYKKWKEDNPDEDYQYDEIHEFLSDLGRGEILSVLDYVEENYNSQEVTDVPLSKSKNEVKINRITPPLFDLYSPDGEYLGELNELEFLDTRVQIKRGQLKGYYFIFNSEKIKIDRNGTLEKYPERIDGDKNNFLSELLM